MFGALAGVASRGMRGAEEIRRQREEAERSKAMQDIQQAALLAGLSEQGISQGGQGMPLGRTGYAQDPTRAPSAVARAKEIAAQREREASMRRRVAVLKARNPQMGDEELMAMAESDDVFEAQMKPQEAPKAPTPVNWQTVETDGGLVQVNPQTGEQRPLNLRAPRREPTPPAPPRPAEFEKKAAFMLEGAERANKVLTDYRPTARTFVSRVPGLGNYGLSEQEQVALSAAEVLHDAYLRLTTGATIQKEELRQAARQYVPLPGDKPAVIRAKHLRRAEIVRAIRNAAQPALNNRTAPTADDNMPYPEY